MMIVGSLSACFFTLVSLFTDDHCRILDYTENHNTVAGVPQIYPEGIVDLLNRCMFAETSEQSAAYSLELNTQVEAVSKLKISS